MKRVTSYGIGTMYLLWMTVLCAVNLQANSSSRGLQDDSIRVQELIIKDTVALKFKGPTNDVNFYMNGLVFLSNTKYHQQMIPDHITFGVVKAFFVPLEYIALESSRPLFENDDFPYSPAGMSFTRDYRNVYFTKPVQVNGRRNVEKIYEMSIINGKASRHNQMEFTGDPSRYLHPAISLDDAFMIFSSDRSPSNGGLDLFISRKTPSGWSTPSNLGSDINTSGHEWYPYLDHRNNLYFSSSGHMGYGGYDVYVCFFNGTGWDNPQNLTEYINTPGDELGFSMHPNRKMAIFSKVMDMESDGEVLKMGLNNKALLLSGIEDNRKQDISLLFKDLVRSGYTSGKFVEDTELLEETGYSLTSLPLLSEEEPEVIPEEPSEVTSEPLLSQEVKETEPEPETVIEVVQEEPEPEPVLEPVQEEPEPVLEPVIETEVTEPEPVQVQEPQPDPNRVVFRVQILSRSRANSTPSVTISGAQYETFEYFYKGAYRVTVGEFDTVQDALAFRTKCKTAGYNQAFVAAFRGNERELDPAVFRR
jgi:hypothetical protein